MDFPYLSNPLFVYWRGNEWNIGIWHKQLVFFIIEYHWYIVHPCPSVYLLSLGSLELGNLWNLKPLWRFIDQLNGINWAWPEPLSPWSVVGPWAGSPWAGHGWALPQGHKQRSRGNMGINGFYQRFDEAESEAFSAWFMSRPDLFFQGDGEIKVLLLFFGHCWCEFLEDFPWILPSNSFQIWGDGNPWVSMVQIAWTTVFPCHPGFSRPACLPEDHGEVRRVSWGGVCSENHRTEWGISMDFQFNDDLESPWITCELQWIAKMMIIYLVRMMNVDFSRLAFWHRHLIPWQIHVNLCFVLVTPAQNRHTPARSKTQPAWIASWCFQVQVILFRYLKNSWDLPSMSNHCWWTSPVLLLSVNHVKQWAGPTGSRWGQLRPAEDLRGCLTMEDASKKMVLFS